MPRKTQISDYEPLKRTGITKPPTTESEEQDSIDWQSLPPRVSLPDKGSRGASVPDPPSLPSELRPRIGAQIAADVPRQPSLAATASDSGEQRKKASSEPAPENWVLKRGHSLSYAGLFLFTALVYFRPYELFPSLSWLSSSAFWVALVTLLIFAVTQLAVEGNLTARPREVNLAVLLLAAGLLSVPLAVEPLRAWNGFADFLKVVLMFIVLVNVVRTEKRLTRLWLLVLTATCTLSVLAIHDYWTGRLGLDGVRVKGAIGGLFDNPNDLALHFVTMVPLALALALKSRNPLSKVVYLVSAVVIIGGVVVTFSRGGFLALAFSSAVFMWKIAPGSRVLVGTVGVALMALFIVVAPAGYGSRLSTTQDGSAIARFDDLKRSVLVAARHPVLGVGINNYILFSNTDKASHNAYTQVASEMGVAAFAIYVLFMIAPFKRLRKIERESYGNKANRRFYYMSICLQASLAGYMVASFFASVAFLWYIYYLVAYAVCLRRLYEAATTQDAPPTPTIYERLYESPRS
jgi:O-Antigen ligase